MTTPQDQKMRDLMSISAEIRKIDESLEREMEQPEDILNSIEDAWNG